MSAPYWVIREGKVRGKGRYWDANTQLWYGGASPRIHATRYFGEAPCSLPGIQPAWRIVRVTPKPRATVTLEHHMDTLHLVEQLAREEALDEAEKAVRTALEPWQDDFLTFQQAADAIAALRGGK